MKQDRLVLRVHGFQLRARMQTEALHGELAGYVGNHNIAMGWADAAVNNKHRALSDPGLKHGITCRIEKIGRIGMADAVLVQIDARTDVICCRTGKPRRHLVGEKRILSLVGFGVDKRKS